MAQDDLAKLVIRLEAQNAGLRRGLDGARRDVTKAAKAMETPLQKFSRGFDAEMRGLAGSAGRLGGALSSLGPVGIGLAASFGGAALALREAIKLADQAVVSLSALQNTAEKLGVTTDALQELRFASEQVGVPAQQLDVAFQRFTRRLAEAQQGSGKLVGVLQQYNIAVRNADGSSRAATDVLRDLADAAKGAESGQEALRIAFKAFDSEGAALVNLLKQGREGIDNYAKAARDAGVVIDAHIVKNARDAGDKLNALQQQNEAMLNRIGSVFIEWSLTFEKVNASIIAAIADIADAFASNEFKSADSLRQRLVEIEGDMKSLSESIYDAEQAMAQTGDTVPLRSIDAMKNSLQRLRNEYEKIQTMLATPAEKPAEGTTAPGQIAAEASAAVSQIEALQQRLDDLTRTELGRDTFAAFRAAGVVDEAGNIKAGAEMQAEKIRGLVAEIAAQETLNKRRAEARSIVNANKTAEERLAEQIANVKALMDDGLISLDEYTDSVIRLKIANEKASATVPTIADEIDDFAKDLRDVGERAVSSFEDALLSLGDSTRPVADSFKAMINSIIQDIARLVLRRTIMGPLGTIFDGLLSSTGPIFGGGGGALPFTSTPGPGVPSAIGVSAFADGGNPPVGVPSLVGERGPELFVPRVAGTIIPNDKMGGGGMAVTVVQNINVTAGVAPTVRAEMLALRPLLIADAKAATLDAIQRGGQAGRVVRG